MTSDLDAFVASLTALAPPAGASPALQALWWDAKGDWDGAHDHAQADSGPAGALVHAYLHRKQGDLPNARYWYAQAGRPPATDELASEWRRIVAELLGVIPAR